MAEVTTKLRKILVASDLSDQAGIAIERALELGLEHGAEVVVVHVIDEDLPADAQSYLTTTSDHDIRGKLAKVPLADKLTKTIDIVVGRPDLDIVERAEIENADLIVVGLHKRLLDENLAIQGTIVERIIQGTHRPVLVVKNKPAGPYRSVAVGVDFTPFSLEAVRAAAVVAPSATLHLVHAFQSQPHLFTRFRDSEAGARVSDERHARMVGLIETEMKALEQKALATISPRPDVHHVWWDGEAHDVLKAQTEQAKADLISVGTHGRMGLARTILGSVATEILNDRMADVVVVRPY